MNDATQAMTINLSSLAHSALSKARPSPLGKQLTLPRKVAQLCCCLILFICSCTTQGPNGSVRKHYFGYTVVTIPHQPSNGTGMDAKEITNVGISLGFPSGISFGYNQDKMMYIPPDGRSFIVVQFGKQFEDAKQLIQQLNNIGICVIQSPTLTSK